MNADLKTGNAQLDALIAQLQVMDTAVDTPAVAAAVAGLIYAKKKTLPGNDTRTDQFRQLPPGAFQGRASFKVAWLISQNANGTEKYCPPEHLRKYHPGPCQRHDMVPTIHCMTCWHEAADKAIAGEPENDPQ